MTYVVPLSSQNIPTEFDPAFRDNWYDQMAQAIVDAQNETITKTVNQDFADYILSRPRVGDYGEPINALGSITGTLAHNIASSKANHFSATLIGNVTTFTLSNPTATGNLCVCLGYITQDSTGGRTITFGSAFKSIPSGSTFALSNTAANSITRLRFETIDAGTTWYVSEEVLKS